MRIVANENCPMLCGIWIFVDLLGDHLPKSSLFSEPLASKATDWMPANLDRPKRSIDDWLCYGDRIGLAAKTYSMLQRYFTFVQVLLPISWSADKPSPHNKAM